MIDSNRLVTDTGYGVAKRINHTCRTVSDYSFLFRGRTANDIRRVLRVPHVNGFCATEHHGNRSTSGEIKNLAKE